jgi:hypothetical protein
MLLLLREPVYNLGTTGAALNWISFLYWRDFVWTVLIFGFCYESASQNTVEGCLRKNWIEKPIRPADHGLGFVVPSLFVG